MKEKMAFSIESMIWDWYPRVWSHDNGTHCKWHKNEMYKSKNLQISV